MSQIDHTAFKTDLQLKTIELLRFQIQLPVPVTSEEMLTQFNFNITLETQANKEKEVLFVIVSIDVRSKEEEHYLGNLTISCIYGLSNFAEIIKFSADGKTHSIPQTLTEILNSISISTARGYMAATFKGTILHNAFLPIIDPKTFKPAPVKESLFKF